MDRLLKAAPGVRVLVTSREPLQLRAEQLYALAPLPVPPTPRAGSTWNDRELTSLSTYGAVSLFITRASAVRLDFTLTAANAAAIAAICVRLEGLPLALELAAARTRVLSPDALLPRLDDALRVLVGGNRDMPTRHQTLRATIAWSYDALDPAQQRLLDRLSVFPGNFSIDAAEAVCGAALEGDGDDLEVFEGIGVLVDRSLLQLTPTGTDQRDDRYSMLVSIRQYALGNTDASGHSGLLKTRHRRHYLARTALPADWVAADRDRRDAIVVSELHNVRAALADAMVRGDPDEAVTLAAQTMRAFRLMGLVQEALETVDAILVREPRLTHHLVDLLQQRAVTEAHGGSTPAAVDSAVQTVAAARALGDPSQLARALLMSAYSTRRAPELRALISEARALLADLPATGTWAPVGWSGTSSTARSAWGWSTSSPNSPSRPGGTSSGGARGQRCRSIRETCFFP